MPRISFLAIGVCVSLLACSSASKASDPFAGTRAKGTLFQESHRLWIENSAGGAIFGSRNGGYSWTRLGSVETPIQGEIWLPTQQAGVLAFNFLRGPSNVFASAVNAIHLRFSDPVGYSLPADVAEPLIAPQGVSLLPRDLVSSSGGTAVSARALQTDIPGGTSLFGSDWSPRMGSEVLIGDGVRFAPIAYDSRIGAPGAGPEVILIRSLEENLPMESLEIENRIGGNVTAKWAGSRAPQVIARVEQAVRGVGRFVGSEFVQTVGSIRANHAGVLCVGTTDIATAPDLVRPIPANQINELRGGFQIVPSIHYRDESMRSGGNHSEVYLVVGPVSGTPADAIRYDSGVEGTYPLFNGGFSAGKGTTWVRFTGESQWIELRDAIAQGRFVAPDGKPIEHLRGYQKTVLENIAGIRLVF